jgi:hypothetical protein
MIAEREREMESEIYVFGGVVFYKKNIIGKRLLGKTVEGVTESICVKQLKKWPKRIQIRMRGKRIPIVRVSSADTGSRIQGCDSHRGRNDLIQLKCW